MTCSSLISRSTLPASRSSAAQPAALASLPVAMQRVQRIQRPQHGTPRLLASARGLSSVHSRRRPLCAAGSRAGSLDADIDELFATTSSLDVDTLEHIYQKEAGIPADGAAGTQQQKQQQQGAQRHNKFPAAASIAAAAATEPNTERGVEVLPPEAEGAPAPGLLGRLLDALPIGKRTRGIVMLNLLVILVATNWVVVKDVGASFDPFGFAFLRFAVAAAAFSPFLKAASKDKRVMHAGIELGVWTAIGYIAQSAGLLTTDASRASFLSTFTVLVVPFLAGMTGKGVSAVTWASCVAALLGVGLLEQGGAPPGIGDVWSFLSAVAFGVQVFRTEHHARILGNGASLTLMSVVLTTTMVFSALAAGATHPAALMDLMQHPVLAQGLLNPETFPWQQVLYCGLLTTDLALMMEVFALQDVSSVEAAIIYTLEPVLGAGMAWVMLGERIGAKGLAGAAIILLSSLITQVMGSGDKEEGSVDGHEALPSLASKDE